MTVAPTINDVPSSLTFTEDAIGAELDLTSVTFTDGDLADGTIEVEIAASSGTFSLAANGGLSLSLTGNGTSTITISGPLADLHAYLAHPSNTWYAPAADLNGAGAATITITARDPGNIAGGTEGPTVAPPIAIDITAVNDAPVATVPAEIAVTGGTATPLTGISFVDVDAETAPVTVTLSVPDGSLAAITGAGVIVSGTSTSLILSGTVSDINAFVAASNVSFTPAPGATGDVTLTVAINDGGNTGSGGPLTDTATTSLTLADGAPTVTAANISISGATGTGGAFKIGDTVTAEWDNSADGDNSPGVIDVTIDFSAFGGGSAVIATDSGGIWTATYTITSGAIDATNRNVSVSATNADGTVTTADTANATVDNEAPTVTDANISISGASGTGGEYKIGDTVTATWNDTAGGDGNSDTISGVTVDFSAFGGGSAVAATNAAGTWTATYVLAAGSIDATNLNISVTAIDNAGNATTTADATDAAVDVVRPLVTSVVAPTDGTYVKDDTLAFTVTLDESVIVSGGSPQLAIDLDTGGRVYANYVSGSGTDTLTFDLVVSAGHVDDDGIEIVGLEANGATITDAVGNAAVLTLQNVADTSGVLIDATPPGGGGGGTPPPDEPFLIRGTPDDDLFREIRDTGSYQGEDGRDTLVYSGARDDYSIDLLANGTVVVMGPGYRHTLQSVERIEFNDGALLFDLDGNSAAGLYRLYGGAFDRSPDEAGLLYWTDWLDDGGSLTEAASHFLGSDEFAALYGSGLSDDEFVSLLYENVLDRPGEQAGVDYWIDYLESGGDPAKVLFFFTQLPEYVGLSMPDIENGYWVT